MRLLLTFALLLLSLTTFTQSLTLKGTVQDKETGERIPFVQLLIHATNKGTTTNVDGHFTLFNIPTDTSTILISHIGYGVQKLKLTPSTANGTIKIEIEQKAVDLKTFEITESKDQTMEVEREVSKMSINPAQIVNLPNLGEEDVFRSMQLLPGISGSTENSGLYVRGGTPDQNLVLLDGITVYHVDHFFGIFSAFNSNALKDVQIYKGGFEAKYGNRISSVVDMVGKSGNTRNLSATAGVNMLSSNAVVELPLVKEKLSLLIAARRSYTDFIQSATYNKIFNNIEEEEQSDLGFGIAGASTVDPTFYFYDANAKLTFRPNENDMFSVSVYTGRDNLDNSSEENLGFLGSSSKFETTDITIWGNRGMSTIWAHQWGKRLFTNVTASYSNYFSDYTLSSTFTFDTIAFEVGSVQDNNVQDLSLRIDNELRLNDNHVLGFGGWYTYNDIHYRNVFSDTLELQNLHQFGNLYAGYVQDEWKPSTLLSVKGGVRVNYYDATDQVYFEPRLSALCQLNKHWRVKGAWGRYNQFINRVIQENIFGGSRDFWLLTDTGSIPVVSAWHYIAGFAFENRTLLVDIEAWQKDMTGLLEYSLRYGTLEDNIADPSKLFQSGTGRARGIDVLVQRKFGKFTGWAAYTISEVIHTFQDIDKGDPFPALHDQRHEGKLIAQLKLGHFNIASTFVYATGRPYTAPIGVYSLTLLDGTGREFIHVGDKNGQRLPNYHRLDAAINYEFSANNVDMKVGIGVFNVYNRTNIKYRRFQLVEYDPETYLPQEPELVTTDIKMLGIVPNAFFKLHF